MRQQKNNVGPLPIFTAPLHTLIQLNRNSDIPIYRQISRSLREAIISGELTTGTRLPTERALARELGVNRTTIMNAYNELASEGLIEGHVGRGTLVKRTYIDDNDDYINQETPSWLFGLDTGEEALGPDARVMSEISAIGERHEIISLAQATPSTDMLPAEIIQQITQEKLIAGRQSALGYCSVEGLLTLRRALAERMRQRGVAVDVSNILILSGSTQGIGLIGRFLLRPGDEVIVEVPTYLGAIQTFRALGARIIGIPTDNEGLRIDILESILQRRQPRLIYTLPTFQNPTGTVLSEERRRRLLILSKRYQVPILEDDPYSELGFSDTIPQPLKAMDTRGNVLYLSTFSKTLAPGVRVAWLAAAEPIIERLALHKQVFDLNTNAFGQWLVSEILQNQSYDQHLDKVRAVYRQRRDRMLQAIQKYLSEDIRINHPEGGFHLWCRLPNDIRGRTLLREAAQEQVAFVVGEPFHVDGGGHHHVRLSYGGISEDLIDEGIRRIGIALQRILQRRAGTERREQNPIEHIPMI